MQGWRVVPVLSWPVPGLRHPLAHRRHALPLKPRTRPCQRPIRSYQEHASRESPPSQAIGPIQHLACPPWQGSQQEMEALHQLERRLDQGRCRGRYTRDTAVWFLRDRRLDVAEAAGKLEAMLDWRARIGADGLDWASVAKEAASGKVYLHPHRDVLGRPVVVIHVRKHVMGASPGADSQRLCAWILDAALAALPPGQECVLGIFDLKGFSLQNADLGFARFLVDALFTYYPRRLGQAVLVDPPWAFQPGWSVVKPWLGKYGDLVRVCSARQVGVEYFQPGTAPRGFGPS
ncbi:CPSFL1 [Auxenochlorella protothecoides x Auxenochlorella symbiontica]